MKWLLISTYERLNCIYTWDVSFDICNYGNTMKIKVYEDQQPFAMNVSTELCDGFHWASVFLYYGLFVEIEVIDKDNTWKIRIRKYLRLLGLERQNRG